MISTRYEYRTAKESPGDVPCAFLVEGKGTITRIDLYPNGDYLRGPGVNLLISGDAVQEALGIEGEGPSFLEELSERQLELLSSDKIDPYESLPLEELKQLRELELSLTRNMGSYRLNQ